MTFYEQELRKIIDPHFSNATYVGRVCYIPLGEQLRAKVQFVTCGHADHYEAMRISVFNRCEGEVDANLLRFGDMLGVKQVSNTNVPKGVRPYIWADGNRIDWYVYKPSAKDYDLLGQSVQAYLGIFQEQRLTGAPSQQFQHTM